MLKDFQLWAILFLGCVTIAIPSCSSNKSGISNESVGTSKSTLAEARGPEPLKVLIRRRDNSDVALMGAAFLDATEKAANKLSPDAQHIVRFSSGNGLKVEEERSLVVWNSRLEKKPTPKPSESKLSHADFDFVVDWDVNSREEAKFFILDPLIITVKETWKVSKVSDPQLTKTWTCAFKMDGGSDISSYEKTATEQIEKVVAPARGPILKEIRDFIRANRTSARRTHGNPKFLQEKSARAVLKLQK